MQAKTRLCKFFQSSNAVLSYASFGNELDTAELNRKLALSDRLYLPRLVEDRIVVFEVKDLETHLIKSSWGIWEPNPSLCKQINHLDNFTLVIPGLAFDKSHHRLGYGRGHYDSFLKGLPLIPKTYGVGFLEQLSKVELPTHRGDVPLDEIALF